MSSVSGISLLFSVPTTSVLKGPERIVTSLSLQQKGERFISWNVPLRITAVMINVRHNCCSSNVHAIVMYCEKCDTLAAK